jgi:predicted short-subunit dehydrogenase-like oxidoreductase (DUF2520 family)
VDIILAGPGRAGRSLAIRVRACGHAIVGVLARHDAGIAAAELGAEPLGWNEDLPTADLLVIAVRDDAIAEVADRLAPFSGEVDAAVHLSGLSPIGVLEPLGSAIGSFHPLQTLPTPEVGAARLEGAWIAITTDDQVLADRLATLAESIGSRPFVLADESKGVYHAAAAAAANFPLGALSMSRRLFEAAGVPFEAAAPLVEAVVGNAFSMGPEAALTGPIARGDVGTVAAQLEAVAAAAPDLVEDFKAYGRAVAGVAGRSREFEELLG